MIYGKHYDAQQQIFEVYFQVFFGRYLELNLQIICYPKSRLGMA